DMQRLTELPEAESSEVIRLAQQLYERDQAENARRESLLAAAEEVGLPREYLVRAAAEIQARREVRIEQVHPSQRLSPIRLLLPALLVGFVLFLTLLLYGLRSESIQPATAILAPPP